MARDAGAPATAVGSVVVIVDRSALWRRAGGSSPHSIFHGSFAFTAASCLGRAASSGERVSVTGQNAAVRAVLLPARNGSGMIQVLPLPYRAALRLHSTLVTERKSLRR